MLSNLSKLTKFIDLGDLTEDFGGTLPYNHTEWVQNRQVSAQNNGTLKLLGKKEKNYSNFGPKAVLLSSQL